MSEHPEHVHWTCADGGYLPPLPRLVAPDGSKPEPVFTPEQWDDFKRKS